MLRSPEKLQKQVGTGLKASYLSLGILSPGVIEDFFSTGWYVYELKFGLETPNIVSPSLNLRKGGVDENMLLLIKLRNQGSK